MNRFLLILILGLALSNPTHGGGSPTPGAETQRRGSATLDIRYAGQKSHIALADLITVELRVDGSVDLRVEPPSEVPTGWTLVERLPLVTESLGKDRIRWRLTQRFAPVQPGGKIALALKPLKIIDGTEMQNVQFAPVFFSVNTEITNTDLSQLRDGADIEALPPVVEVDHQPWWWLTGAAGILLVVMGALAIRRYFRKPAPASPGRLAMQEWQRLMAMDLPNKGRCERFITLLTMLIRQYLERQYSLPARRQTTSELLRQLGQVSKLSLDEKQFLTSFLERSEQIKFANVDMAADECARWAETARQFLAAHR